MNHQFYLSISASVAILFFGNFLYGQERLPQVEEAAATQAINNAEQLSLALFEFDGDYGSYPSDATREDVEESANFKLPADDKTSNSLLRQLFAAGILGSEEIFYAKIPGAIKGDGEFKKEKALAVGENAFTYIAGLSTAGNPSRPILLCPVIPGTTKFDPKPFGGKAIVLFIDCSVRKLPIEDDGRVLVNGVDILSKEHPVWKEFKGELDIRYPNLMPKE